MSTKQFEHMQQATLERLQARIPAGCPITVERVDADTARRMFAGFKVRGPQCELVSRAQVVTAFIDGYVAAWQQAQPLPLDEQLRRLRIAADAARREGLCP